MLASTNQQLPLLMIGGGGHAKVLHALALALGYEIVGVCDPILARQGLSRWRGIQVLGGDEALDQFPPAAVGLINGIGQLVGSEARQNCFARLRRSGFEFPPLVHPAAWVCPDAQLAPGVQVMAGAIIQPDCRIGENSIINTHASVDHDCSIGQHVHIAPGATVCGSVDIGDGAFIGAGATVIQGLTVGHKAVVGAGATLTRHLASGDLLRPAAPQLRSQN